MSLSDPCDLSLPTVWTTRTPLATVVVRRSDATLVACSVSFQRDGQDFVGEAEGVITESVVDRTARAALAAISLYSGASWQWSYEGAILVRAFSRKLVLVGVKVKHGRSDVLLTGSWEFGMRVEGASASAVIAAATRWLDGVRSSNEKGATVRGASEMGNTAAAALA